MKTDKKLFYKVPFKGILALWLLFLGTAGPIMAQCPEKTLDTIITTNTFWLMNATIAHNIEVASGATLTMQTATFSFIPNVKIIIDYGGHLLINNAILTNKCTGLWGGIVVIGNSEAAQNSSMSSITIENGSQINYAKTGVLMGDSADSAGGGGIMTMTGSSVNNCREGVVFYGYPDSNASILDSSSFTASALLPGYDSTGMLVGLCLNDVNGIIIAGCNFSNSISPYLLSAQNGGSGTGVSGNNSGYAVVSKAYIACANLNDDARVCCPGEKGSFSGFGVGISNFGNNGTKKRIFSCEYTTFTDNYVDIFDSASQYTLITKCDFERDAAWFTKDSFPSITTDANSKPPNGYPILGYANGSYPYIGMYGIFSTKSSNIDISENVFYWEIAGEPNWFKTWCTQHYDTAATAPSNGEQVFIQNSGGSTASWPANGSRIYYNKFGIDIHTSTDVTYCGNSTQQVYANGMDGNNGGLEILCNTYNVRGWTPTSTPRIPGGSGSQNALCDPTSANIGDWIITNIEGGSLVFPDQGDLTYSAGAGNNFTDYHALFPSSPSLSDNGPYSSGATETNILVGTNFFFNYWNHASWSTTTGDIYPEIWTYFLGYTPVTVPSSYHKYANNSGICSSNDCLNFVLESTYTPPGGPPSAPLFVPQIPSGVKLYPNPTANLLNIEYNFDGDNSGNEPTSIQLQIIDFSGKTISTTLLKQTQGSMTLDTKTLASGVYFYRFTDTNQNKILNSGKFAVSR